MAGKIVSGAAVGEYLAAQAGEPPQNAAAIGALMNKREEARDHAHQ